MKYILLMFYDKNTGKEIFICFGTWGVDYVLECIPELNHENIVWEWIEVCDKK